MKDFQKGLTVDLIATSSEYFVVCHHDEPLPVVVERNRSNIFDFLPVVGGSSGAGYTRGRIVGLVETFFRQGDVPRQLIHEVMHPLSDKNLIGADASILDFIRNADEQRCRLVVSGMGISGLVSLSDLQRLQVRAALFGLVTHLEIIMADAIRRECRELGNADEWLERLSPGRRSNIDQQIREATVDESLVDSLLFTQFGDKETIIRKSPRFKRSKTAFKSDLAVIRGLRDALAHANDYASTHHAAIGTCQTVRLIEKWSETLSTWPNGPDMASNHDTGFDGFEG